MTASVFFITLLVLATVLISAHCFYLPKRDSMRVGATDPKKRPFCNAFTGCGRKRSNIPAQPSMANGEPLMEESIGSLLELSAEPAVEDISRQIMSEAKLLEAIREVNVELSRARQQQASMEHKNDEELAAASAAPPASRCVLPSCFIK